MKEAQRVFQDKKEGWQSNMDTLNADYQRAVSNYHLEQHHLTDQQKAEREQVLRSQYKNVNDYAQLLDKKAEEEDQLLTEGVMNQIDAFIKAYSINQGYDLVIGTTNSGNLLYGKVELDITDQLIKALNDNYKK